MQVQSELSLSRRALMALVLWAGFYLLAFGMAAGLLYAAWALISWNKNPGFLQVVLAIGSAIGALGILYSSFPRWDKFHVPGPKLDPKKHPHLFEEIRRVARDTRQRPPSEVYLLSEVNAWVSTRGGFLGLFTKRVLAVGLPLMKVLTHGQFRCILAHEFGHYAGGDTRLGPWIYKTNAAIQRTLEMLEGADSVWRFPFLLYGRLFTRISLTVSQQQELAADALAARIGGGKMFGEALRLTEGAGDAFPGFVRDELLPVLNAGFRPPFGEGFQRFLAAKDVVRYVRRMVHRELASRKRDPYRTHPPLHERLEALASQPPGVPPAVDPPALSLLEDLDALETDLLAFVTQNPRIRKYPVLAWNDVGEKAFLPMWRERAKEVGGKLAELRPEEFPDLNLTALGRSIEKQGTDADARSTAMTSIGVVLGVALRDRGWALTMDPGERVALTKSEIRIEPMHIFIDLAEGKLTREGWKDHCRSAGIEGMTLGSAPPTA